MPQGLILLDKVPEVPGDWDYDNSLRRVKKLVYKWKNLTAELAIQLYIAREALTSQRIGRGFKGHTWSQYCEEIGSSRQAVDEWLRRWFALGKGVKNFTPFPLPNNRYRTIVIDPPWPIEKILRDVRPRQSRELDYPTMTIEEIKSFPIKELFPNDGCHVYLWTTQKYLPTAFEVFEAWGVNYIQTLIWHKNVGFTPFGLFMNSAEFVLFGKIGNLPLLKAGKKVIFEGKVREHSRKPNEFYELVRTVSPEPRIDVFSREWHEGFDQYGNEITRFSG